MRTFFSTALLATLALLLAAPGGALAAKPSFSHDQVDDTFDGFFCGAPASVHFQLNGHQFIFTHSGPFPYFKGNGVTRVTWTNPNTGSTVELFSSGSTKDLSITDNGDGTITILSLNAGNTNVSGGGVTVRDVGRIVTKFVVDYNGTPSNTDDDTLVAPPEILSEDGAHPILGSNSVDLCAIFLPIFNA